MSTRAEADDELGMVSEDDITESTVRKMCSLLEKRILSNQEARTKFPDQPTKFMDSEVELQETLESMQVILILHIIKACILDISSKSEFIWRVGCSDATSAPADWFTVT